MAKVAVVLVHFMGAFHDEELSVFELYRKIRGL